MASFTKKLTDVWILFVGDSRFPLLTMDTEAGANTRQFRSSSQHMLMDIFVPVSVVCEE